MCIVVQINVSGQKQMLEILTLPSCWCHSLIVSSDVSCLLPSANTGYFILFIIALYSSRGADSFKSVIF